MAELAASALAAAGASAAAAGTTAASVGSWLAGTTVTTAAGVTTALAPAASTLTALQGLATVGSMTASLLGGLATWRQSADQARFAELDASGAKLDAEEKALRIQRETLQKVGASRVAFAASGLDVSGSAPIEASLASQSDYEQDLVRTAGDYAAAKSMANAEQYRSRGAAGMIAAAGKAAGAGLDYKISIARRG